MQGACGHKGMRRVQRGTKAQRGKGYKAARVVRVQGDKSTRVQVMQWCKEYKSKSTRGVGMWGARVQGVKRCKGCKVQGHKGCNGCKNTRVTRGIRVARVHRCKVQGHKDARGVRV